MNNLVVENNIEKRSEEKEPNMNKNIDQKELDIYIHDLWHRRNRMQCFTC